MNTRLSISAALLLSTSLLSAQMASHSPTAVAKSATASHASAPAKPQDELKPVARVNGTVLTERDLMREIYTIFPYAAQHDGVPKKMEPEMRKGALAMIEFEELVYQEALRRKLDVPAATLKADEGKIRARFQSQQEFETFVQSQFGSHEALRAKIRRSVLIETVLKQEVSDKAKASAVQARAYYDANPKKFDRPETFTLQTISIIPPPNESPEVRKEVEQRAHDAITRAKATKSYQEFGLLAEKVSDDDWHVNMGDRKAVAREQLPPEIVKAALAMKVGTVSDLIQLGPNYTMFRLNGHDPAGKVSFDSVKTKLQEELTKQKSEQLRASFDKRLRRTAKVEEL